VTCKHIQDLLTSEKEDELRQLLCSRIEFGTAGLRAKMEAGFSRMNDLTVIQATQGVIKCLLAGQQGDASKCSVVIGHDHRCYNSLSSERFARLTAACFLHVGIKVYYYRNFVHTPLVPFGVKIKKASCGIMITASHNPKADNGYKLYWDRGCQIIPPLDSEIAQAILENLEPWAWRPKAVDEHFAVESPLIEDPTDELLGLYLSEVGRLADIVRKRPSTSQIPSLRICYTAMHGIGLPFIKRAFDAAALPAFFLTPEQVQPDPEFPTVQFPNPEEGKGALELAFRAADSVNATLVFANDPDADRLAIAEKQPETGNWYMFTGNQIGIILSSFLLEGYQAKFPNAKLGCLATTVSSMMIKQMASQEGLYFEETLTGFKWLGNIALDMEEQKGCKVFFAFEQAIGFMCGDVVRDKDGVSAAVCAAELAHFLASSANVKGPKNLYQYLQGLYVKYGLFVSNDGYIIEPNPKRVNQMFMKIRPNEVYDINLEGVLNGEIPDPAYPKQLGDFTITSVRDLTAGFDTSSPNLVPKLPVSRDAEMITFHFDVPARLATDPDVLLLPCKMTLRTSGTEPKVKYYTELAGQWIGDDAVDSAKKIASIQAVAEIALNDLIKLTKETWLTL
jgi:phosphomannomutase